MVAALCAQNSDVAIREAFKKSYFPSGLKLSQFEDVEFFNEGHAMNFELSRIQSQILILIWARPPALMDQVPMRIQILIPTVIVNLILSPLVVGSQRWLPQRELWIWCGQTRIEAFGVLGMFSTESCISPELWWMMLAFLRILLVQNEPEHQPQNQPQNLCPNLRQRVRHRGRRRSTPSSSDVS